MTCGEDAEQRQEVPMASQGEPGMLALPFCPAEPLPHGLPLTSGSPDTPHLRARSATHSAPRRIQHVLAWPIDAAAFILARMQVVG